MTKQKIVIIDYGLGNLYSVLRALEKCEAKDVVISSSVDEITKADKLILPGVGAFSDGINGLKSKGLVEPIIKHGKANKPLLGICLGMQLLATASEEFGQHQGLDLIPGTATLLSENYLGISRRKIPFIGWSKLNISSDNQKGQLIFNGVNDSDAVYLVHSYAVQVKSIDNLMATYEYGGEAIAAAININNIFGLQFHPEKSGPVGLRILKNFLDLSA
jgi:glutamine amidotransferase